MRDFIESLIELEHIELFERARTVRGQNALSEWQMAAMLMAIERQRAYLECGCSSITVYAEKKLGLHPKKTRALLRLARLCTYFELASQAFKQGRLCWTKLREIGRVIDDHNEAKWVDWACRHTVRQVEKAVAKPPASLRKPTSRLEYPTLFDVAACPATAQDGPQERVLLMPGPDQPADPPEQELSTSGLDEPAEDDCTEDGLTEEEYYLSLAQQDYEQRQELRPRVYQKRPLPDWITPGPTDKDEQPEEEPPPTRLIRMTFVFKPDEYAVVEAALRKAKGQMRKHQTQSEQLVQISKQFLASGSDCTKARYPVVIQIEGHDAVYVTDRGALPVAADKLQSLVARGRAPRKSPVSRSSRSRTQDGMLEGSPVTVCAEQPAGQAHVGHTVPAAPMSHVGHAVPAAQMSHVGQAVPAAQMSHVGQAVRAAKMSHVGQAVPAAQMSHVGQAVRAAKMSHVGHAVPAAQMSHVGHAVPAAQMSHVGHAVPAAQMSHVGQAVPAEHMSHDGHAVPAAQMSHMGQAMPAAQISHVGHTVPAAQMSHMGQAMPAAQMSRVGHTVPVAQTSDVRQAVPAAQMSHVGHTVPAAQMPVVGQAVPAAQMSYVVQAVLTGPLSQASQAPNGQMSYVEPVARADGDHRNDGPTAVPRTPRRPVAADVASDGLAAEQPPAAVQAGPKSLADETTQIVTATPAASTVKGNKRRTARQPNAIREVLARTGWTCTDCGSRDVLELDHRVPLCKGGGDRVEDHDPLCRDCHAVRHARDFEQDSAFIEGRRRAQLRRHQKQQAGDLQRPCKSQ
jgi:hypothetical protein